MTWLGRLFGRAKLERELNTEIRFHLEEHIRGLIAAGLTPDQARREARMSLGGPEQVKEETRDARGTAWLEDWWHDTRFALRTMRRAPGFTAAAVLTLAVGIGANSAVFSLVDALLLKTLPLNRPDQLFVVARAGVQDANERFSYPRFSRLRASLPESAGLAAMTPAARMFAAFGATPEVVTTQLVSGEWFPVVGVAPAAGRLLGPGDNQTLSGHPVTVISYAYWNRRFGRSPSVVGSTLRINGTPLTVVGVSAEGFFGLTVGEQVDAWIPAVMQIDLRYHQNASNTDGETERPWVPQEGMAWLWLVARVPAAVVGPSVARLNKVNTEDLRQLAATDTAERRYRLQERLVLNSAARGLSPLREEFSDPLVALMISVGLVLLIACANLASLLLARSTARSREIAVRVSLGARPGRLVRQVLTESLTLALIGGALSIVVARAGGAALLRAASSSKRGIPLDLPLDLRLLAFAFGISLLTGLIFGLAPAAQVARANLYDTFKTGGRVTGGRGVKLPLGRVLVVSQIALSLVLVVVAGLFARTLHNLLAIDPGYDREQVVEARIDVRAAGYDQEHLAPLYQRLLDAVRAAPGVRSVSLSLHGLAGGSARTSGLTIPGESRPPGFDNAAQENLVTPEYFATVGMPILRGRGFGPYDGPKTPQVVIVNEAMARYFFGSRDPIGLRFGYDENANMEVVGVVRDAKVNELREATPRMVFHPLAQAPEEFISSIEARISGPVALVVPAVKRAVASVDQNLPIRDVTTVGELLERGLQREQFASELASLFGALAALLASIGLYGMISYSVARRTNELGIRLALGAKPKEVRWLVIRETLSLVAGGLGLGLLLLLPLVGAMRRLVYGLSPRDPATIVFAAGLLLLIGALAGAIPAWRASRVDPATALRAE
ncbi:MAG: ABC transporter permease [Gemmatimonadota bacterium]